MKTEIKDWTGVWQLPLSYDYGYAFSENRVMALTFDCDDDEAQKIVDVINGDSNEKITNLHYDETEFFNFSIKSDDESIKKPLFCVRGWGHLIGPGGLGLSEERAAELQDEFIEFIKERLS